jgi:hypothetical protein
VSSWQAVVPAVRFVQVVAEKNAWRGDVGYLRHRRDNALALHVTGEDDLCPTCGTPGPCATRQALTEPLNPLAMLAECRAVVPLPLTMDAIRAAVAEAGPDVEDRAP